MKPTFSPEQAWLILLLMHVTAQTTGQLAEKLFEVCECGEHLLVSAEDSRMAFGLMRLTALSALVSVVVQESIRE